MDISPSHFRSVLSHLIRGGDGAGIVPDRFYFAGTHRGEREVLELVGVYTDAYEAMKRLQQDDRSAFPGHQDAGYFGDRIFAEYSEEKLLSRLTMTEAEALLPPPAFVRIHRSYLVASGKVERIGRDTIWVAGRELPVGAGYAREISKIVGS
jgi:hypothetical protein